MGCSRLRRLCSATSYVGEATTPPQVRIHIAVSGYSPPNFVPRWFHDQSTSPKLHVPSRNSLQLARLDNGGTLAVLDSAAARASGLNGLDNVHGLLVSDLAEDDVATVEPRGDDGGDEELGAVAAEKIRRGQQAVRYVVTYVLGPALAMDRRPGRSWVSLKFSSPNFSP